MMVTFRDGHPFAGMEGSALWLAVCSANLGICCICGIEGSIWVKQKKPSRSA
jgi:hypothetical protein